MMKKNMLSLCVVFTFYSSPSIELNLQSGTEKETVQQSASLEIIHTSNEGVLLSAGDKEVLIDGLYRKRYDYLPYLEGEDLERVETAQKPFDDIEVIIASHTHLDHFGAESVGRHLTSNQKSVFISNQQVYDELAGNFADFNSIRSRAKAVTPGLHERISLEQSGIKIDILRLLHSSGRFRSIQNIGTLIEIGGKKVLTVGDADPTAQNFEPLDLDRENIDVAILPSWFLSSEQTRNVIKNHINPKHLIILHIATARAKQIEEQVKQAYPEAVIFTKFLQKVSY